MTGLEFEVFAAPAPQGSKRAFVRGGRANIVEVSKKVGPWRDSVVAACRQALLDSGNGMITGPVAVGIQFWMPRPANRPKTMRVFPTTPPDIDKLVRSTLDALVNAGAIEDDSFVVNLFTSKRYSVSEALAKIHRVGDRPPGALIEILPVHLDAA